MFIDTQQNGGKGYIWTDDVINDLRENEVSCGLGYNTPSCKLALTATAEKYIKGKVGVVVGTQVPWAEASLLNAGAAHVTTIEYMAINTSYPHLSALHPSEVAKDVSNGQMGAS